MPYAKALYEVVFAQDPTSAENVVGQLERVADALDAVPDFHRVLTTPMVPVETKTAILEEVLSELEITEPARRFIHVVQHHYRMEHMRDIAIVFRDLVDRKLGRTRARVEVVGRLADDQQRHVVNVLSQVLGSDVVADFEVNEKLLAGFRVQVGSKVFDGSLVGQVDRLSRETLME
jgi:F-type H+-transporting ATPase subunit delta